MNNPESNSLKRERPPPPTQNINHWLPLDGKQVDCALIRFCPANPEVRGRLDGAPGRLCLGPPGRLETNQASPSSFFISPSKGNTRNIKKLEERKTDPLSLEGYVSSTALPRPPEKGRGGCRPRRGPVTGVPEQACPGCARLPAESP